MNQEHIEEVPIRANVEGNQKGENAMSHLEAEIHMLGDKEEEELHEWNKKRGGYMFGTQETLIAMHGGRLGDIISIIDDDEHKEVRSILSEEEFQEYQVLHDVYFNAKMTPVEWHESKERQDFYRILFKVGAHPDIQKYLRRGEVEDLPLQ